MSSLASEKDVENLKSGLSSSGENFLSDIKKSFNDLYEKKPEGIDLDTIKRELENIEFPVFGQNDDFNHNSVDLSNLAQQIGDLYAKHSEHINTEEEEVVKFLKKVKNCYLYLQALSETYFAFSLLGSKEQNINKDELIIVNNIYEFYKLISINVNNLLQWLSPEDFSETSQVLIYWANLALSDKWINKLEIDMTTQDLIHKIRVLAKSILWDISNIKSSNILKLLDLDSKENKLLAWNKWFAEVDQSQFISPGITSNSDKYEEALLKKYRRQGLII